jgi:hypothetical protein
VEIVVETRIMRSKISGNFVPSRCITNDNIISDIVEPNIPDTIANIKQKSLHGRYFKELEQPEINIQASHAWLKVGDSNYKLGLFHSY